jgi:long-subunit acyl-CoA synthetase (AMP-forming)
MHPYPCRDIRLLSYLPLSHAAGLMVDIISPLCYPAFYKCWVDVAFARPYDLKMATLPLRIAFQRPVLFLGVPRVWEKIAEKMKAVGATMTGVKKIVSTWAKVSLEALLHTPSPSSPSLFLTSPFSIFISPLSLLG